MSKIKDQNGFSIIEILLTVVAVVAIGAAIYYAYQAHHKTVTATKAAVAATPALAATKTAILADEKASFSYPSTWTLSNTNEASPLDAGAKIDRAIITSPDGFTVSLSAGLDGLGGACEACAVVSSKPVTALGQSLYINFDSSSGDPSTFDSMFLTNDTACSFECILADKNIVDAQGQPLSMVFQANFDANASITEPISVIGTNADVLAAEKIFTSLHY